MKYDGRLRIDSLVGGRRRLSWSENKGRGGGGGEEARSLAPPLDPPLGFSFKIDLIFSGPVQVSSGRFLKYYSSFSRFTDLNPSESGQNSSSLIVLFSL